MLDEIEIVNNRIHGYGAVNFGRNLSQCYLRLAERAVDEDLVTKVDAGAKKRATAKSAGKKTKQAA